MDGVTGPGDHSGHVFGRSKHSREQNHCQSSQRPTSPVLPAANPRKDARHRTQYRSMLVFGIGTPLADFSRTGRVTEAAHDLTAVSSARFSANPGQPLCFPMLRTTARRTLESAHSARREAAAEGSTSASRSVAFDASQA